MARLKRDAAEHAVSLVESGMVVGLGTGSTAIFAIRRISELLASGTLRDITGVPTSAASASAAQRLGVPLLDREWAGAIDITIDGADEVDPSLDLIKGGGGALLREKIVAQSSRREVIVVDETKLSPRLGTWWPVPVEVIPFGWRAQSEFVASLGAVVSLRANVEGQPVETDNGNYVLDCAFGPIADVPALAERLAGRAGIVEHGLFVGLATDLIVAREGGIEHRVR
ncbi:MAG: ribose-5-phosphate isomerase RpiA [Gemmatimonadota bacterium]|nr:ribose-5-phosphate isomerase RpiA [Gemmatimonadota bacterium]